MKFDIKERRKELGWSQYDLAKKVGVSEVSIRKWERGVTTPKPENQEKLEKVLREVENGSSKESTKT